MNLNLTRSLLPASMALLMTAPLVGQKIDVPVTVDTLANGLTLIVHEDHSAPIVAVNIWYHVGSGSEEPGRTGFAHLFEHLMFMGSEHVPYPQFDRLLESAGGSNNGSTTEDRTNYYEYGPRSALSLMLWLEADRMGWLLPVMDSAKVDAQREVVKNERRQRVDNQPYGKVTDILPPLLFPEGHPYSWPVIGSMDDLNAASLEDVKDFFRTWYAPNNASLVVAGDVDHQHVLQLVEKYFGAIPRGPKINYPKVDQPHLTHDTLVTVEDRVQLAQIQESFLTTPAFAPDDAALQITAGLLTGSKSARLTRRLQYQDQSVVFVFANVDDRKLAGVFDITARAKPGLALTGIETAIDEELQRLATDGPTPAEMERVRNSLESSFLARIQTDLGKANQLNSYYYMTGDPNHFQEALDKLKAVTANDVQRVVRKYLLGPRAIISVVPQGKTELAATPREVTP